MAHLVPLLERIQADEGLPPLARELFATQIKEYTQGQAQIDEVDAKLMVWHRADTANVSPIFPASARSCGAAENEDPGA